MNSIFVKDDNELVINFNFSGGNSTLTFTDFKAADDAGVFGCRALLSTITRAYELVFYGTVFALIAKIPQK